MPNLSRLFVPVLVLAGVASRGAAVTESPRTSYPPARKAPQVDVYHGVEVADPYRWLEDADTPETVAWVESQNRLTRSLLDRPERDAIRKRVQELFDYPKLGAPERQGDRLFYMRNSGLQNQAVLYVKEKGVERVLLDPNALAPDGTVALYSTGFTQDGALMGYALSRSGSDRLEILVRDVATGKDLPDRIQWAKFTAPVWTPDKKGFYYTRFPQPGTVPPSDEQYFGKVYYHRLGEPQEKDTLVFERPDRREGFPSVQLSLDGRWLVLTTSDGSSDKSEVHVLDRTAPGARPVLLSFTKGFGSAWRFAGERNGRLFLTTDHQAPLWRVVAVDHVGAAAEPVSVVPEGQDKLAGATLVNDHLVLLRMRNANDRLYLHGLDGRLVKEVELPALGSIAELTGEADDKDLYLTFTSYTYPATPYRYDFAAGRLVAMAQVPARVDPAGFEVTQAWYPSKDGTKVSMFLVHKKGLERDGRRPTLLYGYGGFNVSQTPVYSASRFAWLEKGGVLAVANLRGGGEYGEKWHQAGMLARKQNVFDDFIAAAEWLVKEGYTRPDRLAIQGGSNGGLLVGAAMTQRPDLFGAVICQVPVADMLRYHLFTVGRFWIPEYGSAEDPAQFKFLYAYSPLHRVKDGTAYPATLITTADTDDRVAPGMAKKFAARLQEATAGPDPILIRVETKAGHGQGKPISKLIDEAADLYTFLMWQLGMFGEGPAGAKAGS
jgi:prolyl oligopeptidase